MDRISDLFAFGGGCLGVGANPLRPRGVASRGRTTSRIMGVSLSTQEWEGPLTMGLPCAQSNGTSPGEPAAVGMRNPGGGGNPFTLGRESSAGQPVATNCTQQGETAEGTAPPGPQGLGDQRPVQGGMDYIPGAPPVERATSAAYSGMVAAIAKWGTGTQESTSNHWVSSRGNRCSCTGSAQCICTVCCRTGQRGGNGADGVGPTRWGW
jgi:hypothetical protein